MAGTLVDSLVISRPGNDLCYTKETSFISTDINIELDFVSSLNCEPEHSRDIQTKKASSMDKMIEDMLKKFENANDSLNEISSSRKLLQHKVDKIEKRVEKLYSSADIQSIRKSSRRNKSNSRNKGNKSRPKIQESECHPCQSATTKVDLKKKSTTQKENNPTRKTLPRRSKISGMIPYFGKHVKKLKDYLVSYKHYLLPLYGSISGNWHLICRYIMFGKQ